jgi:hypothetical protein
MVMDRLVAIHEIARLCAGRAHKAAYQAEHPESVDIANLRRRQKYATEGYSKREQERRRYREKTREKRTAYYREKYRALCDRVFEHYGPRCVHCGESDRIVLTVDHVNNDGNTHRNAIGQSGTAIYTDIVRRGFPDTFQILCRNCNWRKEVLRRGD